MDLNDILLIPPLCELHLNSNKDDVTGCYQKGQGKKTSLC